MKNQYVSGYRPPTKHPNLLHTFKIPISSNSLFKFRTKTGYTSFMPHASRLQPSFKDFYGTLRIILSDGDNVFDYCRTVLLSTENTDTTSTSCYKTKENEIILEKWREKKESNPLDIHPSN